jgi:hypothetical protein
MPEDITKAAMGTTLATESFGLRARCLRATTPFLFTLLRPIVPTLVFILRTGPSSPPADDA